MTCQESATPNFTPKYISLNIACCVSAQKVCHFPQFCVVAVSLAGWGLFDRHRPVACSHLWELGAGVMQAPCPRRSEGSGPRSEHQCLSETPGVSKRNGRATLNRATRPYQKTMLSNVQGAAVRLEAGTLRIFVVYGGLPGTSSNIS